MTYCTLNGTEKEVKEGTHFGKLILLILLNSFYVTGTWSAVRNRSVGSIVEENLFQFCLELFIVPKLVSPPHSSLILSSSQAPPS